MKNVIKLLKRFTCTLHPSAKTVEDRFVNIVGLDNPYQLDIGSELFHQSADGTGHCLHTLVAYRVNDEEVEDAPPDHCKQVLLKDNACQQGTEEDGRICHSGNPNELALHPPGQCYLAYFTEGTPHRGSIGNTTLSEALEASQQFLVFRQFLYGILALVMNSVVELQCMSKGVGTAGSNGTADALVKASLPEDVQIDGERMARINIPCAVVEAVEPALLVVELTPAHRNHVFQP